MSSAIHPPKPLLVPLKVPSRLLMGPGPSNCPATVISASAQQMIGFLDEDFLKIMEDVKCGIQYAFQTSNKFTFAVSGTGHCAMETAVCNLLEPGDVFLIASSGIWGTRVKNIAERLGAKCVQVTTEASCIIEINSLEKIVMKIKPKVTFLCHGDSSTGLLQPLEGFSEMLRKYNCLLLVDSVASLGSVPLYMDELGIDVLYSGSQKVLNAPPGLSPISFSLKAMNIIQSRKSPVTSFYMDALLLGNYWKCDDNPINYHHTAPINLMYALREALSILAYETLEKSWKKHKYYAEMLYKKLEDMGLNFYIKEKTQRLPTVTTVEIPEHINGQKVIRCMKERFGIDIAGGLGSTSGKVWRIGLMGYNCNSININLISHALSSCIQSSTSKSNL